MNQDWGQARKGQPALRWVGYLSLSSLILAGLLKASEPFLPRANNDWEPSHQNVTVLEYRPLGVANSNDSQDGRSKPLPDAVLTEAPPELVAQLQAHEAVPIPIDAEAIEEEEEEEEEPELDRQLVDIPEPSVQEEPVEAEYMAEFARQVDEQTRSVDYRVNPTILADTFSEEEQMRESELDDLDVQEDSSGATPGLMEFDPRLNGNTAVAISSLYAQTNQLGQEAPALGGSQAQEHAGSPNNDRVLERPDKALKLNAEAYRWAAYINRIRRVVNFYWKQNLDNLPPSLSLYKPSYTTVVEVILNEQGAIQHIAITEESDSIALDRALINAFQKAGPFENPPTPLVQDDGTYALPTMAFTVETGPARIPYAAVDPRQGVQFPGLLKAPR